MKYSVVAVLAAAAGAVANSNVTYTTEVVESYVTYCPGPTQITHGDKTYTITKATTLTITDCPCTVTKPVYTTPVVTCHTCTASKNATVPVKPTASPTHSVVQAGATQIAALSGAGLAAILGLAAFL